MKIAKTLQVQNKMGLHGRPATKIAKLLAKSSSFVYFTYDSKKVDAKQVMNILLLGAGCASNIHVEIEGDDAHTLMHQLTTLFENKFGE